MNTYTFDEISVGLACSFERRITVEMENAFREISGDENPLHKDDQFAQNAGGADDFLVMLPSGC